MKVLNIPSWLWLLSMLLLLTEQGYSAEAKSPFSYSPKITPKVITREDPETFVWDYRIVGSTPSGEVDKAFMEIDCVGGCYTVPHVDFKFLLVDCFDHNGAATSCRLDRYDQYGLKDISFKIPFATETKTIVFSTPEHEIKSVKGISVEKDGSIYVTGLFISPLVSWTQKDAELYVEKNYEGVGDNVGRFGILGLHTDGTFKSFVDKDESPKKVP